MTALPGAHKPAPLAPVEHKIIATWPEGTFLENIAILTDGRFAISAHNRKEILTASRDGATGRLATLPLPPAGLVSTQTNLFAVCGEPGQGPHQLLKIGTDGTVENLMTVPDTMFLNGFTPARPGHAYTVDSLAGLVIEINLETPASRVVLQHELLTKSSAEPMLPGANGIKFGAGALFITNTDRALVLRAELNADGPTGEVAVFAEHLRGDDLALDEAGTLYVTNHIINTLTMVKQNGERLTIAGPEQGMVGSTACAFHPDDPTGLYVTATGGVFMPLNGVMQKAKLVRLETGMRGRPVAFLD